MSYKYATPRQYKWPVFKAKQCWISLAQTLIHNAEIYLWVTLTLSRTVINGTTALSLLKAAPISYTCVVVSNTPSYHVIVKWLKLFKDTTLHRLNPNIKQSIVQVTSCIFTSLITLPWKTTTLIDRVQDTQVGSPG